MVLVYTRHNLPFIFNPIHFTILLTVLHTQSLHSLATFSHCKSKKLRLNLGIHEDNRSKFSLQIWGRVDTCCPVGGFAQTETSASLNPYS